jgi:hypothetical protein
MSRYATGGLYGLQSKAGESILMNDQHWSLPHSMASLFHTCTMQESLMERLSFKWTLSRVTGLTWFGPRLPQKRGAVYADNCEKSSRPCDLYLTRVGLLDLALAERRETTANTAITAAGHTRMRPLSIPHSILILWNPHPARFIPHYTSRSVVITVLSFHMATLHSTTS